MIKLIAAGALFVSAQVCRVRNAALPLSVRKASGFLSRPIFEEATPPLSI